MTESTPSDEQLRVEYVPVSQAVLWDKNPKEHDIGTLSEAIAMYGFKDPPKFEPALNGGTGGIVEGNGRIIALRMMMTQGMDRPRGILKTDNGEWAVPILFGVDAESEMLAQAYALDHNLLVLSGGEFTALDASRLWNDTLYIEVLTVLAKEDVLPVAVDGDDLDLILETLNPSTSPTLDKLVEQYGEPDEQDFWPIIRVKVSPDTDKLYRLLLSQAPAVDEGVKFRQLLDAVNVTTLKKDAGDD